MAVSWSAAEYVTRVVVQTAQATGQPVREVARESFALTLWTWAELQQMDREAAVDRMGDRTDMAGLTAMAYHEPQSLQKAELRYLSAAGRLSRMLDETRDRLTAVAAAGEAARVRAGAGA